MCIKPQKAAEFIALWNITHDTPGCNAIVAQQLSHKYANMNAPAVCQNLEDNHHRKIAHSYLQDVSDWVGGIAQAKEELWE